MPTSTKYQNPKPALTFRERSSSSRQNTVESYIIGALDSLDDDVNRLESVLGLSADQALATVDYSSNRFLTDAESIITSLGKMDEGGAWLSRVTTFNAATDVVAATDVITVPSSPATATRVKIRATSGATLPTGITATSFYYWRQVSATTGTLHPTSADATGNTNKLDITAVGAGTCWVISTPSSFKEGDLYYDGQWWTYFRGASESIATHQRTNRTADGFKPLWNSASQIKLGTGRWRDSTDTYTMVNTGTITIDITVAGANGLQVGLAEASATTYYVYIVGKSQDGTVAGMLSTTNEQAAGTITLPTGYDIKAQLPIAVRNDGSSNLVEFDIIHWGNKRGTIMYREDTTMQVLSGFTTGTFTTTALTNYVPAIAIAASFAVATTVSSGTIFLRKTGSSVTNGMKFSNASGFGVQIAAWIEINTSLQFDVKISGGTWDVYCKGYVAEVA